MRPVSGTLGDHRIAGAQIHAAVERPHPLRRKHADVDLVALDDVLVADRLLGRNLLGRHLPPQLALQDLHGLERMIDRLLADHQAEARQVAADHVVERAVAGMALDVLEQQGRRPLAADEVGDGRRLEVGIDLGGDALELSQRLDLLQPGVEIARVGAAGGRASLGFLELLIATARTDRDAHVHGSSPVFVLVVGARPLR